MTTTTATTRRPAASLSGRAQPLARRMGRWHKWLGLALGLLWLVQAATGSLITFHWELTDLARRAPGAAHPFDAARLAARIEALEAGGWQLSSAWTSAGLAGRYQLSLSKGEATRHLTLAADGTPLAEGETRADALSDFLVELHQTLKADDKGGWAIGIGGAGLAVMLALGLVAVWPRRGRFVRALRPGPVASARVRPLAWHRALGLWAAAPALLMATTGTAMVFDDGFRALLGGARPDHASHPGPVRVDLAAALATALAAAPGSRLTAIIGMPTAADATYRFRLLAPGEWRRAYGTSMVDIDAGTGAVALLYTPATATFGQRLADSLYALHTGEVAGWPGRLLVTATGLWLVVMIALGFASWWRRRGQAS